MVTVTIQKFCTCLELWKGCVLAGIFSMATSIFDLLWSIAHMLEEESVLVFYMLFSLGVESVLFIAASGLLFVGLVKKSKWLLIPWILFAIIDIVINFVISFLELTLPNRTYGTPCIIPVAGFAVTVMVCAVLLYCLLCVYAQFLIYYGKRNVGINEIRVSPAHESKRSTFVKQKNGNEGGYESNALSVPQVSTPRDAW